jgi:hypothetical protein
MAHPAMERVEADTEMKLLAVPEHEQIAILAHALGKQEVVPKDHLKWIGSRRNKN